MSGFVPVNDLDRAIMAWHRSKAVTQDIYRLENGRVPLRTLSAGFMAARQILEIIGQTGLRAIVNRSCAWGMMNVPPDLMRDLADGRALRDQVLFHDLNLIVAVAQGGHQVELGLLNNDDEVSISPQGRPLYTAPDYRAP